MENKLLDFVPPNFSENAAVLVIENEEFLQEIRELMPNARIAFLSMEKSELCEIYNTDFLQGDYINNGLPTEPKIFDVIIAKELFTYAPNCFITLLEINHLLKDSGFLLTEFYNVRNVEMLENLKLGEFPTNERKFWAKWDIVKILDDAIYKEIRFLPGKKIAEKNLVNSWEKFGFDNFSEDLLTKIWLVKAQKCSAEVIALKEIYTPEIRAELARILHRVEYKIEVDKNLENLKNLCEREQIFYDYLSDFIDEVVIHRNAANFIKTEMKILQR